MYFEKYRYKTVFWLIKHLTPRLHRDMNPLPLPRGSIEIMSKVFDNKLVKGVEIGVWKGDNAQNILNSLNIKKLTLIDPWTNYAEITRKRDFINFDYNYVVNRFKDYPNVEIIKGFSNELSDAFLDNSLDFVYIDGNHSYNFVLQDIELWTPKVKKGGFIAGHDIFSEIGVLNAVKDYCFKANINFNIEDRDWYFIKEGVKD